ncbi:MAG TPA: AraC family transcriptional regulator ligand-binding domain-containing protein [Rubrivivax sp.]|nr:AraC family transcriptional regulator ligand-binding domain-containing protein [Rubrivivax sp.]HPO20838.1 AraC family transcriptional regulator ligand-binding domain-containing protein [Rubrivivax sp.]
MQSVSRAFASSILQRAERAERDGLALPAALVAAVREAARVPLATQDALWEACCTTDAAPPVGLRIGLELQLPHLDSAALQLIACDTLGEALRELVEVAPVTGDGGDFELTREGARARLVYRPPLGAAAGRARAVVQGAARSPSA